MTKIRLQSICLQNFKGTRYVLLNIDGKNTNIEGANGSGKTTIYRAYYWCLTGKTLEPNEVVQMLDEKNQVIHKIETSVTVTLMVDDSYEMVLERKLVEDWKALGQPTQELRGTKQQRFINDVPLSVAEFNAKLNAVCDLEKLLLLSDITKFMSLKMEERRKILMSVAGEVDEEKLMAPYPLLVKAVAEKKTVDELKTQSLSTKKRANDELKTIPSQIDAQDKLKSNEDFEALKKEKSELDTKIADIDSQLKGSTEELQSVKEHNAKVQGIEQRLDTRKREWSQEFSKKEFEMKSQIATASQAVSKAQDAAKKNATEQQERISKKGKLNEQFQTKRNEWMKVNESDFNEKELEVCPHCGHRFTEDERLERKNTAIEKFNADKAARLKSLLSEAETLNQQILVLTGSINEYDKITKPADEKAVKEKETALSDLRGKLNELMKASVTEDEQYKAILAELNEARANAPVIIPKDNSDIEAQKKDFTARRDEVIRLLAGEQQNERIEKEMQKLEARSSELAQIVADCDNALYQIQEYRKAKVDAVEGKVNAFFAIARWKFFEKNVSNDDLQEVCICHHNGVDYNSTNGADKINLGVDIVAGLSRAMGIEAPIFVDCAESVADIVKTDNQLIKLTHVPYAKFSFNNF